MSQLEQRVIDLVCAGVPLDEAEHMAAVELYGYDLRAEVCDE